MMQWVLRKSKSGLTTSKMAAHWWTVTNVLGGPSFDHPRNCWWGWDQHRLCTLNFNRGFAHVQSGGEICAQAAFTEVTTAPLWGHAGHAGVRQWGSWVPEDHDHWWWDMCVQIWPRNKGAVITVEAFFIPKAQKSTIGAKQSQGAADCFLWLSRECASQFGTRRPHSHDLADIRHLRAAVRGKRPNLRASCNWQLHHDNAPAHSSHLIRSFLAKHGIPVVRQAPYSPDMAHCDLWLSPKLKRPLKGSRFDSRQDIMQNTKELRSLPECFQQWKECRAKCVESQEAYFERD
jgi:hypothetical protein